MKLLSQETPASIVFFDLLCEGNQICGRSRFRTPAEAGITAFIRDAADPSDARDQRLSIAADWFRRFEGAGLDGVMAKRRRVPTNRING